MCLPCICIVRCLSVGQPFGPHSGKIAYFVMKTATLQNMNETEYTAKPYTFQCFMNTCYLRNCWMQMASNAQ